MDGEKEANGVNTDNQCIQCIQCNAAELGWRLRFIGFVKCGVLIEYNSCKLDRYSVPFDLCNQITDDLNKATESIRLQDEVGVAAPLTDTMIQAVDVFCGIGGLTHGLRTAGIDVVLGVDNDPSCRYAYETNNPGTKFVEADIREVRFADFDAYYGESAVSALVGCAPCQPFSAHTRRIPDTEDCELIGEFSRLIQEGKPDLVSMENVQGLRKHDSFLDLLGVLSELEYDVDYDVLNFYRYGVPQRRRRLVLIASRRGPALLPDPLDETKKVSDFIDGLQPICAGETSLDDRAHTCLPLSSTNLSRIRQSKPGGNWKDWDDSLINPCHARAYYPASYGRMQWDKPAPTITTQFCYYSTGRFGHPTQDRVVSVREAALLQTFPAHYDLVNPDSEFTIRKLARHVGNAVPVKIGELVGYSLKKAVSDV